jgi:hypothetical protein
MKVKGEMRKGTSRKGKGSKERVVIKECYMHA